MHDISSRHCTELTELYPVRTQVEMSNKQRLDALPGAISTFNTVDWYHPNHRDGVTVKQLEGCSLALPQLELKVGAQVMLIINLAQEEVGLWVCACAECLERP